ncbi:MULTISPECIES: DUF2127 domain-containing protein [Vibrio]|uniref:DUF2127 domain-containing protein n=1 Tax=Vibrio casei TaxID=673372 RepID=A0A368LI39_9VIBR|nr:MULTISPECIES: DUF2127 domain-containing protein [Vibrio]RCS70410.1 DUF2127 domain-containing protein [Vibrio casei]SJN20725.1 hypothetical protein FM109_03265 [Vibrio casei]HBV77038.1 DUF2127 domain-containing protein [Vibrio sp.]
MSQQVGLRVIATLEASKGILAVLIGFGIYTLFSHDAKQIVIDLIRHCHLNPASYYPHMLVEKIGAITPKNINLLTVGILLYSVIRFIEAYGLWLEKRWTEWFALLSGAIYIPFELYELIQKVDLITVGALVINLLVVGYMIFILKQPKREKSA